MFYQPVQAADIILQPGPGAGKDIWTTSVYSYAPGGGVPGGGLDNEWLEVGGWGDLYYSLIEFDLTGLPSVALSTKIEIFVGQNKGYGTTGMYLDRITEFWDWRTQGTGTDYLRLWWADRPATTPWTPDALPAPIVGQWYSIDITDLYNAWQNGTYPNYGIQLRPVSISNQWNEFYSSDYLGDSSLRPKLVITTTSQGAIDLSRTGQTTCYDSAGAVISCAGTGQDGEIQAGVPWPDPRFTDNSDGTVTDNLTGLMWTQDGNAPGPVACLPANRKTWQEALDYVACINSNSYLGHTDWRLPNVNELESLINAEQGNPGAWLNIQGFNNVQSDRYWSSTTYAGDANNAWVVTLYSGHVMYLEGYKSGYGSYVWPVRSGQNTPPANIWKTGQTTSYAGGDDGDIESGVAWPIPRFKDNSDGTVADNLTGLMWTKYGNAPGPAACSPTTTKKWQNALDYVACLNTNAYLGYTDWRLPNRKELYSLTDFSQHNPVLPSGHPFLNVQSYYWSSSTVAAYPPGGAWMVNMWEGYVSKSYKSEVNLYVWPVRSGQVEAINTFPTLSYSSESGYGSDGVNPDSGTASTTFTYKVIYTDADNDLPAYVKVHIDGDLTGTSMSLDTAATSTLRDGDYTNGEQYYFTTSLAAGTHDYYFDASDGIDTARLPMSGTLSGPTVSDLAFVEGWLLPSGTVGISYVTLLPVSGGTPPYTWNIPSGLPPGVTLDNSTGFITGTPTTPGTYGFTASVTDSNSYTYSRAFSIIIDPGCILNNYYQDSDGDTYGNASVTTQACTQPSGYISNSSDCNDGNASINPGVAEVCNGVDDNCNSQIDEGATNLFSDDFNDNYIDPTKWTDISGYSVTESNGITKIDQAVTDNGGNLNSKWIDINPNNTLTITRKVNLHYANNYFVGNFQIIFDQAFSVHIEYAQMSYGGYPHCSSYGFFIVKNNSTHSCPPQSDVSSRIEPVWDQWFDEKIVYNPATGVLEYFINDQKRTEFNVGALPAGTNKLRLFFNSWGWWTGHYHYFDDLVVSQGGSLLNTYYLDSDNDTYGDPSLTTQACIQPSGYVSDNTDCNDSNGSINPVAVEVCNGVDDNCNTLIDEGGLNTYYRDADNDTYGNSAVTTQSCSQPSGYVSNSSDCNDGNASIKPGATEVCNGVDDNCNSQIDEGLQNTYYRDADSDTYGNASVTTQACAAPSGYVSNTTDCNDGNASINPGATEICNSIDDNCDGLIDEGCPGVEVCDGIDNDNDSQVDEGFPDTDGDGNADCVDTDDDNDGFTDVNEISAGSDPLNAASTPEVCDGVDNDMDGLTDEGCPGSPATPEGTNVDVIPIEDLTLTFDNVTTSGATTVTPSGTGQPPPSGFRLGSPPVYYEITTTATYSGTIQVCLSYDENQFATEQNLRLFHLEGGAWVDITDAGYPDTTNNIICGNTMSFSPFIVAESSSTPTIVSGVNLSGRLDGDQVVLTWSTGSERENEGFIILRAESAAGPFAAITSAMIPATGGFGMRATYTFTDSSVEQGKTYYYRLQDIDNRGKITAHQIIPVTVAVAGTDGASQENSNKGNNTAGASQQADMAGQKGFWVAVVVAGQEGRPAVVETSSNSRSSEDTENDPIPTLPLPLKGRESGVHSAPYFSDTQPSVTVPGVVSPHPGPSTFSVSIEDDKGNIIVVRRVEDTVRVSKATGDLEVTKESGSVTLTWKGRSGVKGFILHRTEKGKDSYTAITSLIPYFGRDDKDIFLYKFTDTNIKPEVQYDYRLEVVKSDQTDRTAQR